MPFLLFALLLAAARVSTAATDLIGHELHVAGAVQRVVAVDVGGDDRSELLVFSVSGELEPQRRVSIFSFEAGQPSRGPRSTWVLDDDAGVFDIGLDEQNGPSLWYCTTSAVRRYLLRRSLEAAPAAETWMEVASLLGGNSEEWVVFSDFVEGWRDQRRETPAIFQPGRLLLPSPDPAQPPLVLPLRTEIDTTGPPASYEMLDQLPLLLTQRLPSLTRIDADGDGAPDLVAALGDRLTIYRGIANGGYSSAQRLRFPSSADPRDETRRQFIQLADVTGDGRADAVLSTLTGGFGNLTHELAVFRGEGAGFAARPANTLTRSGAASLTTLTDFDGNGRHEIVTVTVEIGVRALLSYLLTSRVPLHYNVHRVDESGGIGEQPMMEWTHRVELQSTGATDPDVVTLAGDFDGDGIADVASAVADEEIEIRRVERDGDRFRLGEVIAEVSAPARGQALAPDLNADGRADLVLYAPRGPEGIVRVFLSSTGKEPPVIRELPPSAGKNPLPD